MRGNWAYFFRGRFQAGVQAPESVGGGVSSSGSGSLTSGSGVVSAA